MMKKANIALVFGIVIFALLIYFSDINRIIEILKNAKPLLLMLGFCFLIFSYILRVFRWKILVYEDIKFQECMNILFVGTFGNRVLPLKMGGLIKAFLLSKRNNIKLGSALSSVFIDNFVEIIYVLMSSLFVALLMNINTDNSLIKLMIGIFFGVVSSILLTFSLWKFFGVKYVKMLIPKSFINKDSSVLSDFLSHLKSIDRKIIIRSFVLTTFIWISQTISNFFLMNSIGLRMDMYILYLISTLPIVIGIFSSIPGGLGIQELSIVGIYTSASKILASDATSLAILIRVVDTIAIGLMGIYGINNIGIKFSRLEKEIYE